MKKSNLRNIQRAEFAFLKDLLTSGQKSISKIITSKSPSTKKVSRIFTPKEIKAANKKLKAGIVSNKYAANLTKQPPNTYTPLGSNNVPLGSNNVPLGTKKKPPIGKNYATLGSSPKIIGTDYAPLGSKKRPLGSQK
jgi:hypothetical protein